jgi:glycerol-3-phosphate dehydrogenase
MLRIGLFLYDHLSGRKILPATSVVDLTHHKFGIPLKRAYKFGFAYSDCWVDDARLVVLNALDAAERGASIRTRTKCVRAERGETWRLILNAKGRREVVTARALVNAAGPWVGSVAETVIGAKKMRDFNPEENLLDRLSRRLGTVTGQVLLEAANQLQAMPR